MVIDIKTNMEILLKRIAKKPNYTIGKLYIDGKYFCDTLEDKDRGLTQSMEEAEILKIKIKDQTAIPTGKYKIDMNTVSPRFKNNSWAKLYKGIVPRLINVPGYSGVLIHPGNTTSDTSGCILLGQNKVVGQVINSQITWKAFMQKVISCKQAINLTVE